MAWNKVGTRLLAVYAGSMGAAQSGVDQCSACQPWRLPALATSSGAANDDDGAGADIGAAIRVGMSMDMAIDDSPGARAHEASFAALRKRIGAPAADYRARILLTMG